MSCDPADPGCREWIDFDATAQAQPILGGLGYFDRIRACLKLADGLEGFLTPLRTSAATATVEDRQRVLRLLVKDILIGPEKITIRHRIPAHAHGSATRHDTAEPDTRVTKRRFIHCVGGVITAPLAKPS